MYCSHTTGKLVCNRDHDLSGDWAGHRECHILPDWLLVYRIEDQELVHSVEGLAGMVTMPELEYLFAQICRVSPSAQSGSLYFESKVLELLSLIQIQQEHQKAFPDILALDEDTIAMIHRFLDGADKLGPVIPGILRDGPEHIGNQGQNSFGLDTGQREPIGYFPYWPQVYCGTRLPLYVR